MATLVDFHKSQFKKQIVSVEIDHGELLFKPEWSSNGGGRYYSKFVLDQCNFVSTQLGNDQKKTLNLVSKEGEEGIIHISSLKTKFDISKFSNCAVPDTSKAWLDIFRKVLKSFEESVLHKRSRNVDEGEETDNTLRPKKAKVVKTVVQKISDYIVLQIRNFGNAFDRRNLLSCLLGHFYADEDIDEMECQNVEVLQIAKSSVKDIKEMTDELELIKKALVHPVDMSYENATMKQILHETARIFPLNYTKENTVDKMLKSRKARKKRIFNSKDPDNGSMNEESEEMICRKGFFRATARKSSELGIPIFHKDVPYNRFPCKLRNVWDAVIDATKYENVSHVGVKTMVKTMVAHNEQMPDFISRWEHVKRKEHQNIIKDEHFMNEIGMDENTKNGMIQQEFILANATRYTGKMGTKLIGGMYPEFQTEMEQENMHIFDVDSYKPSPAVECNIQELKEIASRKYFTAMLRCNLAPNKTQQDLVLSLGVFNFEIQVEEKTSFANNQTFNYLVKFSKFEQEDIVTKVKKRLEILKIIETDSMFVQEDHETNRNEEEVIDEDDDDDMLKYTAVASAYSSIAGAKQSAEQCLQLFTGEGGDLANADIALESFRVVGNAIVFDIHCNKEITVDCLESMDGIFNIKLELEK